MDDPRHLEYYGGLFGDDQQFDHMGICARAHARVVAGGDGHRQPVEGGDDPKWNPYHSSGTQKDIH